MNEFEQLLDQVDRRNRLIALIELYKSGENRRLASYLTSCTGRIVELPIRFLLIGLFLCGSIEAGTPSLPPLDIEEAQEKIKIKKGARKTRGVLKVNKPKILYRKPHKTEVPQEEKKDEPAKGAGGLKR